MASDMATADDLFDQNPHLDRGGIEDALRLVDEMDSIGVRPSRYRLASPYDRHSMRHVAADDRDDADDDVSVAAYRVVEGVRARHDYCL